MHTMEVNVRKDYFLSKLEAMVKATRQGADVESIDRLRVGDEALVYLNYSDGHQTIIDVSATSDIAVAKRVVEELMK